jgi:RES domain-containing protein
MLVWRLCRRAHADLSGAGGRLASGRWHTAGRPVIYTSYEPALAILEVRVHLDLPFEDLPNDYVLMGIDLGTLVSSIEFVAHTPAQFSESRALGDRWLAEQRSPMLGVPSVLAPRGMSHLINPQHPQASSATIASIEDFKFDGRLWRR